MVDLSAIVGQQIEELDQLITKPIYSIAPDAFARYEKEYFGQNAGKVMTWCSRLLNIYRRCPA